MKEAAPPIQDSMVLEGETLERTRTAIIRTTLDSRVTGWNRGAEGMLGYTKAEMLGTSIHRIVPPTCKHEERMIVAAARLGRAVEPFESVRITRHHRTLHVSVSAAPDRDAQGQVIGIIKFLHDISPLVRRERQAKRLARLHATLSQINRAIISNPTPEALLQSCCEALVNTAGFAMCMVNLFDPRSQQLEPVAIAGAHIDILRQVTLTGDDSAWGKGPSGLAFRQGRTSVNNDMFNDPAMQPWRTLIAAAHIRACAGIPLNEGESRIGVLTVCAHHAGFFQAEEITLLEDVAHSLDIGLCRFKSTQALQQAKHVAEREHAFAQALIAGTPGLLLLCDQQLRLHRWNDNLRDLTGYDAAHLQQLRLPELLADVEPQHLATMAEAAFTSGTGSGEFLLRLHDGNTLPCMLTGHRIQLEGTPHLLCIGTDLSEQRALEQARNLTDALYRNLFVSAPVGIATVNPAGIFLDANPELCQMLGYPAGGLTGKLALEIFQRSAYRAADAALQTIIAGQVHRGEWPLLHRDGRTVFVESVGTRMSDGNLMAVLYDISTRKIQEAKIAHLDRTRRMIGDIHSAMLRRSTSDGLLLDACRVATQQGSFAVAAIADFDPYGKRARIQYMEASQALAHQDEDTLLTALDACAALSLHALREGSSVTANTLVSDTQLTDQDALLRTTGIHSAAAFPLRIASQTRYALLLLAKEPEAFDADEIELLDWMSSDLSYALGHLDTSKQLQHLTYYDPLTGLFNARGIHELIPKLSATARHNQQYLCVCAIDLEHFSQFNDRFGRQGGDSLLRSIGDRLKRLTEFGFSIGRIGGDTFAAVGPRPSASESDCIEQWLPPLFQEPFALNGHQVNVGYRVGIAQYPVTPGDYDSPIELDHAVRALRNARMSGRPFAHYSVDDELSNHRSLSLEAQLHDAIDHEQMVLYYQPRLDIVSGEIIGAEALLRWQHPILGLLPPSEFIELAERTGLIRALGTHVIQRVCRQQHLWQAAGLPIVPIAANVSSVQLSRDNLEAIVQQALSTNNLAPEWLELELTESAVMQDVARSVKCMTALRAMGIKLSLDDFGTGYSSLSYLKQLPFDRVKIDRSFITDITRSVEDAAIALAIIAIARSLKLTSVAEGVETSAQLGFLAKHHCDEMQGFLFSPPVPADHFAAMLREHCKLDQRSTHQAAQRTLLLVDDEPSISKALARLLRRDGYQILIAGSGEQALELLAQQQVHVVVSDQRMPVMTGTELLDKVRGMYPDTIRIILSGYTDLKVITESVNRGAVFRFLTKPWDDAELRDQIRGAFIHYDEQHRGKRPAAAAEVL